MIYLSTGIPGAGKNLWTMRHVFDRAQREGRKVYAAGIDGLKLDWEPIDPKRWHEDADDGSIIIIDECHRHMVPKRGPGATVPPHVEALAEHRHKGIDFYLITPGPMMIDSFVRPLVGCHWHVVRKLQGAKAATIYEWNKLRERPDSPNAREDATQHHWIYDREVFGWYQSTVLDTHKIRVPAKLVVFLALPFIGGGLAWFAWSKLNSDAKAAPPSSTMQVKGGLVDASRSGGQLSAGDDAKAYFAAHRARVPGLAYTAPVYDSVTQPVAAPYPAACIATSSRCQCYTDQATKLGGVPDALCRQLADGGFFIAWRASSSGAFVPQQRPPERPQAAGAGGTGVAYSGYGLRGPEGSVGYRRAPGTPQ